MGMIDISTSGSFDSTEKFLALFTTGQIFQSLERYGEAGVRALAAGTPRKTGKTAESWYYEIKQDKNSYSIIWGNTNIVDGAPLAVLLQVGHGTRQGGYVQGRDYINPALLPIFDEIANEAFKVVRSS